MLPLLFAACSSGVSIVTNTWLSAVRDTRLGMIQLLVGMMSVFRIGYFHCLRKVKSKNLKKILEKLQSVNK